LIDVTLRPVVEEDLEVFFEHQRDPVANALAAFPARERDAFFEHWRKILSDPLLLTRTIVSDGEVAGNIGSWDNSGAREVGYWIGREHWGKGIATSALGQFLPLIEARPLFAHVAVHNIGSIRVLQKCGFVELRSNVVEEDGVRIEELILVLDR
jgi:RimJ/RimL family protein N-acetyltransferase